MTTSAPSDIRSPEQKRNRWTSWVGGALLLVFMAIGGVQWAQLERIDSQLIDRGDNTVWAFFQLEAEYMQLRELLRDANRNPDHIQQEVLSARYEIFASRLPLVEPGRIQYLLSDQAEHLHTLEKIQQLITAADPYLSENAAKPLSADALQALLKQIEVLGEPIHALSLMSNELNANQVSARNQIVRDQNKVSIGLTVFQILLTLIFALLLLRQVRALGSSNRHLQTRQEELRRSNEELEAFSYSVSHDLRSPLNTINGFSNLLGREIGASAASERSKHYLARIQAGAVQMGELIDALLSLAQLSRASLRRDRVDLSTLAHTILNGHQEREPGRVVQWDIQPELVAEGDPRLLRDVLDNLLGNAWKFSSMQTRSEITFSHKKNSAGETVYLVRDNGAGFDMAYSEKLFGAFQRLHTVSEFAGTGIGLATVHRIVRRHGGKVWAESAPGCGATFYFTLGDTLLKTG